jgi:2-C-methyl-D-erythritol 4-phosphate cytidylyltransferase
MSRTIALVTAGGSGQRMGAGIRKQYIEIRNKPILAHTIHRFQVTDQIDEIALTVPEEDIEYVKKSIIERYNFTKLKYLIPGGVTRQDSVYLALKMIGAEEDDILLIHDAVRPFISHDIILECIDSVSDADGSVVGIKPVNTIKKVTNGTISATIDRDGLVSVQTPQTFSFGLIKKCHEAAKTGKHYATDDSALLEIFGPEILGRPPVIKIVQGNSFNIKITDRNDLTIASAIMESLSV